MMEEPDLRSFKKGKAIDWSQVPRSRQREYEIKRGWENMFRPGHNESLRARAVKRMDRVDAMSPEMRAVVYEHGLEIVQILIDHKLKAAKIKWLIDFVQSSERPHSKRCLSGAMSLGFTEAKAIFLIDTILGADYENGQPRFKINLGPNTKRSPIARDDDDEAYYILGPVVTSSPSGARSA